MATDLAEATKFYKQSADKKLPDAQFHYVIADLKMASALRRMNRRRQNI
jgi:TPR repeat protein